MIKLASENGWRPFAQAPKDGTWIVGYRGDSRTEPVYVVMRWWDGILPDDDDDLSTDEEGEWVGPGDGPVFKDVTHWIAFQPHPRSPAPTTAMDDYFGPGTYPTRAERGITQNEIDATRACYAEFEAQWERENSAIAEAEDFENDNLPGGHAA